MLLPTYCPGEVVIEHQLDLPDANPAAKNTTRMRTAHTLAGPFRLPFSPPTSFRNLLRSRGAGAAPPAVSGKSALYIVFQIMSNVLKQSIKTNQECPKAGAQRNVTV